MAKKKVTKTNNRKKSTKPKSRVKATKRKVGTGKTSKRKSNVKKTVSAIRVKAIAGLKGQGLLSLGDKTKLGTA